MATTAPTQFLDVGDTRFAYRRFGNPIGTPVVFTQHLMGNLDNFDPAVSDALAAGREVILFDNAGVASSTGTAPNSIASMATDAARFIDGLDLATVDIVGQLPIMFSPSKESQAAGRAFINRVMARTEDRDIPVSDSTITAYRAAAAQWGTPAEGSFEYLSRIHQPTLIVNGNNDIIIPTINSYHLYQNLPNAQLWLLPDANHGSHFQYPALFARRVIDFLDIEPHEDIV
jgi:pimeloyl-ACP methyl ester carboxylesterase